MELKEFKEKISKYKRENIVFGKIEKYIIERINSNKEEIITDLLLCKDLEFVEIQSRKNETRYALFFIYSKRKGRVYIIKFNDNLRIITAYPLGRRTLLKYNKKRFIS